MQDNLNTQIKNSVDTINKYGEELVQINKQIMRAEAGKVEHANDLRDRRNYILDELSKMGKISYEEDISKIHCNGKQEDSGWSNHKGLCPNPEPSSKGSPKIPKIPHPGTPQTSLPFHQ